MTSYDYLSISLLLLAIAMNSALVYLQKTRQIYRRFGAHAYGVHGSFITLFWGVFIISEFVDNKSTWRLAQGYPLIGFAVMVGALVLFGLALQQIGWSALGNGNFFGRPLRKLAGIYKYIHEPIYWSYAIWFAGIGLVTSLKSFFVFSLVSIIGLVGVESWVERPKAS
jgi:hypothetical protein